MSAILCPDCVADGVDCPLLVDGECLHCSRPDAPIARRVDDAAFRERFAPGSFRWRLRAARAWAARRMRALRSLVAGLAR